MPNNELSELDKLLLKHVNIYKSDYSFAIVPNKIYKGSCIYMKNHDEYHLSHIYDKNDREHWSLYYTDKTLK